MDKKDTPRIPTAEEFMYARHSVMAPQPLRDLRTGEVIDKAMRFNTGKLKWSLVHFASLKPLVEVLMFGAKKYAPDNWKKGLDKQEILESMFRHLTALMDGELRDPESGLLHIGHIFCNAMFWTYFHDKDQTK